MFRHDRFRIVRIVAVDYCRLANGKSFQGYFAIVDTLQLSRQ
jgi:hypothetical protein